MRSSTRTVVPFCLTSTTRKKLTNPTLTTYRLVFLISGLIEIFINNYWQNLKNFVLIKFENDTVVQPVETEWFGFYKPGQSVELETLQESTLYTEVRAHLSTVLSWIIYIDLYRID